MIWSKFFSFSLWVTNLLSHRSPQLMSSSFTTGITSRLGYCFDDQFVICEWRTFQIVIGAEICAGLGRDRNRIKVPDEHNCFNLQSQISLLIYLSFLCWCTKSKLEEKFSFPVKIYVKIKYLRKKIIYCISTGKKREFHSHKFKGKKSICIQTACRESFAANFLRYFICYGKVLICLLLLFEEDKSTLKRCSKDTRSIS